MRLRLLTILALGLFYLPALAASSPWLEVRTPHFVVLTDTNDTIAVRVADRLERSRLFFQAVLPNAAPDADQPITVLALQDQKELQSIEPAEYLKRQQIPIVGFFLQTPESNFSALQMDIHFVHGYAGVYNGYIYFMLRKNAWMPLWLRDGLADFYDNTDIDGDQVLFGAPDFQSIYYVRKRLNLLPLQDLLTLNKQSPFYTDENKYPLFESESWALTDFLQTTDFQNKTHHLADYTQHLMQGEDSLTAARHSLGELPDLTKRLQSYVSQGLFQATSLHMKFNVNPDSFTTRKVSVAEVDAIRADILAHGGRPAEAQALAQSVLKDDPNNARARDVLGWLAGQNHDPAAARKWYEEAAQLDPSDHVAHYFAAVLSRKDPSTTDSAIDHFRRCIQVDPDFAPAYNDLADLFVTLNRNLDEAHMLTIHAVQLDPQNLTFRFTAAQVLEAQHNPDGALMVLTAARDRVPHTPAQLAEIDRRIALLQHSQAAPTSSNSQPSPSVATSAPK